MRKAWPLLATLLAVVAGVALIESRPFLAGARLYECLLILGLVAVAAATTRGTLRNALVACCSLLVGLIVMEGVALALNLREDASPSPVADDSGLSQYRPVLGWGAVKPGVYRSYKTAPDGHLVFDTRVTIDETLNRKTDPSTGARPIVFFGDSWIYGDGVDDSGTLPQAFADLNGGKIPVLNLAFAGWSPAQNLIALQKGYYAKLIAAPRHFILFASTFHLERIACKGAYATSQAPRFVLEGDEVRYAGPCRSGHNILTPLVKVARRFALYGRIAPLFEAPTHRDVETFLKIIETFVATAQRGYGVKTTLLFAPFDDGYIKRSGYTEGAIVADLRKAGVDVLVDQLPKIADESLYWIKDDGHPTALSNKARAEEIEAHLRKVDPAALGVAAGASGR